MKQIAAFILLVLGGAWSIPATAQRISVEENARQSKEAAKKQQKMLKKAGKKQRKATHHLWLKARQDDAAVRPSPSP